MAKHRLIQRSAIFLFHLNVLILVSCNSANNEKQSSDSTSNEKALSSGSSQDAQALHLSGKFDTLYTTKDKFLALPDDNADVVFSYTFERSTIGDKLTMHGWSLKGSSGRNFEDEAELKLSNGNPVDTIDYGPGSYFGNVVLNRHVVKDISDQLRGTGGYIYVGFAPLKDPVRNHIKYRIFLSTVEPINKLIKENVKELAESFANPSPPRNR
jgi:hypothetical protein